MHLRPPSLDRGFVSFLWAFFFFLYLWLGMLAVGVSKGDAFVLSALAGAGIFLLIRTRGEPRRA